MRKLIVSLFFLVTWLGARSQSSMIGKLTQELDTTKADTSRAILLYQLSYYYQSYKPDSALFLGRASYELSQRADFLRGQAASLGQMARAFNNLGNFSKALEYYLEQLKILEKKKDPENIASAYISIALVYSGIKDIPKALFYAYKADSIARNKELHDIRLYTTLDIGDIYAKNDQLDSALFYTMLSYQESIDPKNDSIPGKDLITGTAMTNMGNIFFKRGEYDRALVHYRNSIPFLESMQDDNTLSECYLGLAQTFDQQGFKDSALHYALKSFRLASANQFLQRSLNSSQFLAAIYNKQRRLDSAFAYQATYLSLKDSFYNAEKLKDLQNRTISEQLRQDEMVREKKQLAKERRLKLELLFIGMLIPVFFFFSAYISRKRVHKRVIELSGIFSLIFLFEYITFLIHPVVRDKVSHSPVYEIIIFVALAAILSPTHHRVEYWLISKLTKHHPHAGKPTRGGNVRSVH